VAAVLDLFSRRVVGWALVMAIWRRGKPDALLHHSDRGSQYTSEQFQRLMGLSGPKYRSRICADAVGDIPATLHRSGVKLLRDGVTNSLYVADRGGSTDYAT